ncbi:MAG: hypothetical protein L6Q78_11095 [Bacteroidia bacterium]|nr:hypothetical protein [Bacteroidia bacterium]
MATRRQTKKELDNKFIQGAICAIATMLYQHRDSVIARNCLEDVIGNTTISKLRKQGCDEYDLQILKEHWCAIKPK